ncbi:MAG: NAD(P)-dependent oxidoreductase [Croceibacterium sp.]
MRILLTGASSFTGSWLAAELARRGHTVVGTLQDSSAAYAPLARQRLEMCRVAGVTLANGVTYGSDALLGLVDEGWDAIAYHGADVRNYRGPDFDLLGALERNTRGAAELCHRAVAAGVGRIIVSGTVFEPGSAAGDELDRAVTPYGLSKALSWQVMRFHAREAGLAAGKFVIANPFGRFEQERYCTYLARTWLAGETALVRMPDYVRDNVPISLMALGFADFVEHPERPFAAPSGYVGTQGVFTARFANEIGTRLGIATPFTLARQTDFSEPLVRTATEAMPGDWDEAEFWDDLARYYNQLGPPEG